MFTPAGIASITSQTVNMPQPTYGNAGQPCFSPDGTKFAWKNGFTQFGAFHDVRILSFDRCTGNFDSLGYAIHYNYYGFGLSFSSNSRYLYYSSGGYIYQLDTNAPNITSTDTLVAAYDGYCYPYNFSCTNFWLMYLAANGKIYITSSNYVIDLHYINFPDSSGTACDVVQHGLRVPSYTFRGGLNHPNYYLGCDTTSGCICYTGVQNIAQHDFRFRIYPNPTKNNQLSIGYLLPQNKSGTFQIFDVTGKLIFNYNLPPWSNEQSLKLPELGGGVYQCVVRSDEYFSSKKLAVIR
ncbi:MAG: T9SS type A sorting domain-containing protein [Bacteroidetes bacterium]|nr:T9SS type A sorting domain-containing protein [Bacteroidota bacterium]